MGVRRSGRLGLSQRAGAASGDRFVPSDPISKVRGLTPIRTTITRERGSGIERLAKLLGDAGIKLSSVAPETPSSPYLSPKYRGIAARRGPVQAIVAWEHAMFIAIWNIVTTGRSPTIPGRLPRRAPGSVPTNEAENRAIVDQLRSMGSDAPLTPGGRGVERNLRISGPGGAFWPGWPRAAGGATAAGR